MKEGFLSAEKCRKVSLAVSLLIFVFSVAGFNGTAYGAYYDGSNNGDSWETAYIIASSEDLRLMRDRVNSDEDPGGKYYRLNADIDVTAETDWEGIGEGGDSFTGHFDGQNHTIRLNSQTNSVYAGLFNYVETAEGEIAIRNLNVSGTFNGNCVGTIVHYLMSGIMENCTFAGTITCDNESSIFGAGGLIAHLEGGTVRNCTVNADISGASYAGGIAGEMTAGYIQNCTTNVNLLNGDARGGIVGTASNSGLESQLSGNTWPSSSYPQIGTAGGSYTPSPVTSQELNQAAVSTVVLSDEVISRLAENIGVSPNAINLLTSADFDPSDPPEPTEAMIQEAANQNGTFMAKMNTIRVSKDGWYVCMVTVSDDLVGLPVSNLRVLTADESDFAGALRASFGVMGLVNGVTGGFEISNLLGVKLDTVPKQFLATMMLTAGKSLTTYLVKIIFMLLAGCNLGMGIGVAFIAAGLISVKFFRKKR